MQLLNINWAQRHSQTLVQVNQHFPHIKSLPKFQEWMWFMKKTTLIHWKEELHLIKSPLIEVWKIIKVEILATGLEETLLRVTKVRENHLGTLMLGVLAHPGNPKSINNSPYIRLNLESSKNCLRRRTVVKKENKKVTLWLFKEVKASMNSQTISRCPLPARKMRNSS